MMRKRCLALLLALFCLSLCLDASRFEVDFEFGLKVDYEKDLSEGMARSVPRTTKTQRNAQQKSVRDEGEDNLCPRNQTEKYPIFVEENAFEAPIARLLWSPYDTRRVWVITETGELKMSENAGEKWKNLLPGVKQIYEGQGGDVFYAKMKKGMKVTRDFVNWGDIPSDYPVFAFQVHPTQPLWAAGIFMVGECSSIQILSRCSYHLNWTKDGGKNWGPVGSNVFHFTWGGAGSNGVSEDSLIFLRGDYVLSRIFSLEHNSTQWEDLVQKAYSVTYLNKVLIGVHFGEDQHTEVFESRDDGITFTYPKLPESIGRKAYLLEGPDGVSYLQVPEDGNIYESSEDGKVYSLLLKHVDLTSHGENTGFHSMESLVGNFIANAAAEDLEEDISRTQISHEMGSEWFPIPVPGDMSCAEEVEDCSLNLYGEESGYPILSQKQAAGIIVANGHVGEGLNDPLKVLRTSVFLSRNAGQSFEKILDRPHYFGMGDHGGMLVLLDSEATDRLRYSPNQGIDIENCVFTEKTEITFDALYSEPSNKGLRFLGVGTTEKGEGEEAGYVLHIDLSKYFDRVCEDSDFEPYTPTNMENEPCLLGQKHSFIRRKREKQCFSPALFETEVNSTLCQCERDDYLCDYCYEPDEEADELCVRSWEGDCVDYDPEDPPEDCTSTYEISTGYRKVPRNKCEVEGLEPWEESPEIRACSHGDHDDDDDDNGPGSNYFIIFYLLVAGGVILIVCYTVPPIRKFFSSLSRSVFASRETEDELFGERYKTVDAANAVSLLDSDDEAGGEQGDDDAFLFGDGDESEKKEDDLFGDEEGGDSAGLL